MDNIKDFLVKYGSKIYTERDMIKMEIHIILAALFPIYIGSHASLQRPPSASPPPKSKSKSSSSHQDEEDEEERSPMEGLTPSDAIMFPILASVALGTLYFIIKWLDDPAILNRILGWYFSALGIFGVGRLAKDSLDVGVGFVFPSVWTRGKHVCYVDQNMRRQFIEMDGKMVDIEATHPLAGPLSRFDFPKRVEDAMWNVRGLLKTTYTLHFHIKKLLPHQKSPVKFTSVLGLLIGIATITAYNLLDAPWYLTNLMGFGFCYGSLQLMSPTTFFTGTLVLLGLFFYDITMVFYTPLMVTVATTLDVPIKLVFPPGENGRGSMLGLGDIVLPGILVALALRFDLYLHYLYLQKSSSSSTSSSSSSNTTTTLTAPNKPIYKPATSLWGERFWTSTSPSNQETGIEGTRFPKPYFKAALAGYIIGMITTLIVMNVFRHAQPALLYLVPGVVGSLWGTAVVRGEVKQMWEYTEDGSLEEGEKKDTEEKKKDPGEGEGEGEGDKEEKKVDEGKMLQNSDSRVIKEGKKLEIETNTETETKNKIEIPDSDTDASSILSDGSISWPEDNDDSHSHSRSHSRLGNASEADDEMGSLKSGKISSSSSRKDRKVKALGLGSGSGSGSGQKIKRDRDRDDEDHIFLFSISALKKGGKEQSLDLRDEGMGRRIAR